MQFILSTTCQPSIPTLHRGDDRNQLATDEERRLSDLTLGELLKLKADRGVRVLLLLWDEYRGLMGTHDTRNEFHKDCFNYNVVKFLDENLNVVIQLCNYNIVITTEMFDLLINFEYLKSFPSLKKIKKLQNFSTKQTFLL